MPVIFWVSVCLFFYIMVGYPLLLSWLAKHHSRKVIKAPFFPSVSIIVPVHNGQDYLAEKLNSLLALNYPAKYEIIVIDDGSTDKTEQIARLYAAYDVKTWKITPKSGKPTAVNFGIQFAKGDIIVLTDVRQTLDIDSLQKLTACFSDPSVGVVSGEIVIRNGDTYEKADIGLYWKLETAIRNWLSSIDSIFGANGQFYAIRRSLLVHIPETTLNDDMYLPLSAFFKGYRSIVESDAKAYDYPTSRATEFNRKVRTLAGNYQILFSYPVLGPQNRLWFHYVSYKFGRLLLPWLMILIAVSSFWLVEPLKLFVIGIQICFYLLAIFDPWIPKSGFKKLSSPARTFIVMMIAVMVALKVFFVPAKLLWKVTSVTKNL